MTIDEAKRELTDAIRKYHEAKTPVKRSQWLQIVRHLAGDIALAKHERAREELRAG